MVTSLNVLECFKEHETLACKNHDYSRVGTNAIELRLDEESLTAFTLGVKDFVICSGLNFQVNVWGLEKIVTWLLPRGPNHCILLSNVFLDACSEYVYVISKTPHACDNLSLTACEIEFARLANTYGVPIFIVLDVRIPGLPPINTIIHKTLNNTCLEHLLELMKRIADILK